MFQEPTQPGPPASPPEMTAGAPEAASYAGAAEGAAARRVLVVRSEELHDRIGAAVAGSGARVAVESSPSYLSAMGLLVGVQPDVVIGPVSAMTGMVSSTARALRKLCPGARLVVVADGDERAEAQAALAAGFDQCVYEPADASTLLAAVGVERGGTPSHARPTEAANHEASTNAPQRDDEPVITEQERASLTEPSPGPSDPGPQHLEPPSAPRPMPAVSQSPSDALGDIDLVDALLEDDGDLRRRAARLLGEQSGLPGVVLSRSADQVHPDHAVVAVQYTGTPLGLLHAPLPVTPEQLAPWADWLARWLALEDQVAQLRKLALTDELTGVWNRRYFQQFLRRRLEEAGRERQQVTLLVFDIDDFKQYNDRYGHPAGDEILRETARLIQSLVRDHDVVARIGGDEFAVVFWDKGEPRHLGSQHPDNVLAIARRFQKAICEHQFPKLGKDAVGRLTVSGGLAGFPWDGRSPEELMDQADAMALQSKRNGKNAVCFGPGAAPNGNGNGHSGNSH